MTPIGNKEEEKIRLAHQLNYFTKKWWKTNSLFRDCFKDQNGQKKAFFGIHVSIGTEGIQKCSTDPQSLIPKPDWVIRSVEHVSKRPMMELHFQQTQASSLHPMEGIHYWGF